MSHELKKDAGTEGNKEYQYYKANTAFPCGNVAARLSKLNLSEEQYRFLISFEQEDDSAQ